MNIELELWTFVFLTAVCFASGFVDSIAGGGGLLSVPALLLTGMPPDLALGTNKVLHTFGMAAALRNYTRSGLVVWRLAKTGVPCVLLGSVLGARTLLLFDNEIIGKMIVVLLPFGMLATLMPRRACTENRELTGRDLKIYLPLLCVLIGFYDGFFGPGSGSFFVLALHFILGFELLNAAATSRLFNFSSIVSGALVFAWHGKVNYILALSLAIASIGGNIAGSKTAIRIGASFVQRVLVISLLLLFVSLLWKFWLADIL